MAKERQQFPAQQQKSTIPWLAVGIVVLIVIGVITFILLGRQQKTATTNRSKAAAPVAVTPLYFTDFIGEVEAVDPPDMTALVTITEANGDRPQRRYHVSSDDKTTWQLITITNSSTAAGPLTIGELKPGDTVQVYGSEENLYDMTSFTASRIVKLVSN